MRVPSGRLEVSMAFELAARMSVMEVPCVAGDGRREYADPLARAMALSTGRAATVGRIMCQQEVGFFRLNRTRRLVMRCE